MTLLFIVSLVFFWYSCGYYLTTTIMKNFKDEEKESVGVDDYSAIMGLSLLGPTLIFWMINYEYIKWRYER